MKTITESIILMVMCIVVALFCLDTMIGNIILHRWWFVIINAICVIANSIFARIAYKTAKGYEEILCGAISDLQFHNMMLLLKDTIKSKEANPKDKTDEVEEHNGTPV